MRKLTVRDVAFLIGVGLAGYGIWHFSPAVAFILAGVAVAAGAVLLPGAPPKKDGDA